MTFKSFARYSFIILALTGFLNGCKPDNTKEKSTGIFTLRIDTEANKASVSDTNLYNSTIAILRNRLSNFEGITEAIVKPAKKPGYIQVSVKGDFNVAEIRQLILTQGKLEILPTYSLGEMEPYLKSISSEYVIAHPKDFRTKGAEAVNKENENVFFTTLFPGGLTDEMEMKPQIAIVEPKDTQKINQIFQEKRIKSLLPSSVSLRWNAQTFADGKQHLVALFATKKPRSQVEVMVNNDIAKATKDFYSATKSFWVRMNMTKPGREKWMNFTDSNTGKHVVFCIDGRVYTSPRVNSRIDGGVAVIDASTEKKVTFLANILNFGCLPLKLSIESERKSSNMQISK